MCLFDLFDLIDLFDLFVFLLKSMYVFIFVDVVIFVFCCMYFQYVMNISEFYEFQIFCFFLC